MLKHASTVALCLVASSSMAFAQVATTGQTVGTVLVNHGAGFVRVGTGAPLAPGDIISARRGGRTLIVFAGGCTVKVRPGRSVTIGQTVCDQAGAPPVEGAPVVTTGLPGGVALGGAVIAAGGIAAAIALGAQKDTVPFVAGGGGGKRPVSP